MNETKMILYYEIHRLNRLGFNKSQIERKVRVYRDTVRKYLTMDFEEMVQWTHSLQTRQKKLDYYETTIVNWLKEHPDLSAAQVEDWLLEEYPPTGYWVQYRTVLRNRLERTIRFTETETSPSI